MRVFDMSSKSKTVLDLNLSMRSLYALAAPSNASVRDDVIKEVVQKASGTGKPVKHKDVARVISERNAGVAS